MINNEDRQRAAKIAQNLWAAFDFTNTPQGDDYWTEVCHNLEELGKHQHSATCTCGKVLTQ
jgi:hypothetical protein